MAAKTNIEWTDHTHNEWFGCTKVSPACDHCYAETLMSTRLHKVQWGTGQPRQRTSEANRRKPLKWNATPFYECSACGWRGDNPNCATPHPGSGPACDAVMLTPTRRRVFCASLADVFDNEVPDEWRLDLFDLIRRTPNLDWLLLTKRIGNVTKMVEYGATTLASDNARYDLWHWLDNWAYQEPPANIWLGATICNQEEADRDIPKLLATPAAKRFISVEPMLGAIDATRWLPPNRYYMTRCEHCGWAGSSHLCRTSFDYDDIICPACDRSICGNDYPALDWVICGGESGPGARPMHPDWPRALRDQCQAAGVPFLFKQWGEWLPRGPESFGYPLAAGVPTTRITRKGHNGQDLANAGDGGDVHMQRVGKKAAGNHLDGVQHLEFPK